MRLDEYWKVPAYAEMKAYDIRGFTGDRPSILWFDLELMDLHQQLNICLIGRDAARKPGGSLAGLAF